ncbi:TATA element modulatory factor-like [Sycon ciliatum]|uniref:TATA element modulatory factor-like n=1 Tax=Sycon ciliatum TaxID=27933 RepID=UPI0031F6E968
MSGWGFDSSALGSLARSALSNATKQIDKVLDIDDSQDPTRGGSSFSSPQAARQPAKSTNTEAADVGASSSASTSSGSFWDSWDLKTSGADETKILSSSSSSLPVGAVGKIQSGAKASRGGGASRSAVKDQQPPGHDRSGGSRLVLSASSPSAAADSDAESAAIVKCDNSVSSNNISDSANAASAVFAQANTTDTSESQAVLARAVLKKRGRPIRCSSKESKKSSLLSPASSNMATSSLSSTAQTDSIDSADVATSVSTEPVANTGMEGANLTDGTHESTSATATTATFSVVAAGRSCSSPSSAEPMACTPASVSTQLTICSRQQEQSILESPSLGSHVPAASSSSSSSSSSSISPSAGTRSQSTRSKSKPMVLGDGSSKTTGSPSRIKDKRAGKAKATSVPALPTEATDLVSPSISAALAADSDSPQRLDSDMSVDVDICNPLQSSTPLSKPMSSAFVGSNLADDSQTDTAAAAAAAVQRSDTLSSGSFVDNLADCVGTTLSIVDTPALVSNGGGSSSRECATSDLADCDDSQSLHSGTGNVEPRTLMPDDSQKVCADDETPSALASHCHALLQADTTAVTSQNQWPALNITSSPGENSRETDLAIVPCSNDGAQLHEETISTAAAAPPTASTETYADVQQVPAVLVPEEGTTLKSDLQASGTQRTNTSNTAEAATDMLVNTANAGESPNAMATLASENVHRLRKEVAECREIIDVRETKLVQLSRQNIDLQETNSILQNQLEEAEKVHRLASTDVGEVSAEFTDRLAAAERRYQLKCEECKQLRNDGLQTSERDQDSRNHYEKMLLEKDDSIQGLMAEGEKLSKQQLQHSNTIKKLRAKEKELDQQVTTLRRQTAESQKALEKLQAELKQKDETERKYQESLLKVNTVAEKQSKELHALKRGLGSEEEKSRTLQSALDNAYKEIATLRKDKASNESAANEAALESEIEARREVKQELEKTRMEARQQQESLLLQLSDLRASMSTAEQVAARREDHLKQEVNNLRCHLQEAEGHSQELTNNVSGATRPLLRQIENLQSSHSAQVSAWEKLERNLSERLAESQAQVVEITEHAHVMSDRAMELQTRLSTVESSSNSNRQDKARLVAELELLRSRYDACEEDRAGAVAKLEALRKSHHQDLDIVRKEKLAVDQQLDAEKSNAAAERKRANVAEDRLEKERQRHHKILGELRESQVLSAVAISPVSPAQTSNSHPLSAGATSYPNQGDILEQSLLRGSAAAAAPAAALAARRRPSSPDSDNSGDVLLRSLPVAVGMDKLHSLLKQRQGEVSALQSQVILLEKARASVAQELVTMAAENEQLSRRLDSVPALKRQVEELDKRYNTMLQMYGEKAEEANELRMDLDDVKALYKQQIHDLITKGAC